MWIGVTKGLARVKLSGSDKKYGEIRMSMIKMKIVKLNPKISFHEKKGWKETLSIFLFVPRGLLDPV